MPLADEHLKLEIELAADPEVMRYLTGRALSPDEVDEAHRRRLAAEAEVPGVGFWGEFTDHDFVGWSILRRRTGPDQPSVAGEADLGYGKRCAAAGGRAQDGRRQEIIGSGVSLRGSRPWQ